MRVQAFLLIPIITLIISCSNNQKNNEIKNDNSTSNISSKDSIEAYYDKLGIYSFKFNTDISGDSLKSVKIYSKKKLLQEIIVNEIFETENKEYKLTDVNFDGFKDILALKGSGSGGKTYWAWNFSKKDNTFKYNSDLSDRFGLEIDSANKRIMFSYSGGFNVKIWDTFKYKNDKLFLLSSRNLDGNDTTMKYIK